MSVQRKPHIVSYYEAIQHLSTLYLTSYCQNGFFRFYLAFLTEVLKLSCGFKASSQSFLLMGVILVFHLFHSFFT